ncbi:MAG: 2-amino-4-hydroxy-6-hydroxymethyldihydropteridine diphosphokinase [Aeromonas sp.]
MFYLCSIGSNIDPHRHVSEVLATLLVRFDTLQLSSVICTKPVGMHSCHDFLNCLLILQTPLDITALKQSFIALEMAHGRNRHDPLCKIRDRPLDIDILASHQDGDFSHIEVDAYLSELLAEWYGRRGVKIGVASEVPNKVNTAAPCKVLAPKVELHVQLPSATNESPLNQMGPRLSVGLMPLTLSLHPPYVDRT